MFTETTASVPEKSDSGIDAEIIDDLENLYHPRHHYGCDGAKTPYCLIKIGGRQLRLYAFHYPSFSSTTNSKKPSSKTLSFIDILEKQLLRKWTLKAALIITIQVRQVNFIHIIVLIYTDSYMKQMLTKKDLARFWDLAQNLPVTA